MCTHFSWSSQRLEKHLSGRNSSRQIGKNERMGTSAAIGEGVKFLATWSVGKSSAELGATRPGVQTEHLISQRQSSVL